MNVSSLTGVLTGRRFRLIAGQERRQLLKVFRLAVCLLLFLAIPMMMASSFESIIGGLLIGGASLTPAYLWCRGKALGMPIFPVFALVHLWTCAIPIMKEQRLAQTYSSNQRFVACLTIAGFLAIGTLVWYSLVKSSKRPFEKSFLSLKGNRAENFFLISLMASTFFVSGIVGGWFSSLNEGIFSLIRGVLLSLNSLATFVLAYRWGTKELSRKRIALFFLIQAASVVTSAASLLIVGALSGFVLAVIGFSLGRRQVPVVAITLILLCLVVLHYGKGPMRAKYSESLDGLVQPWEYPAWFAEWVGYSATALLSDTEEGDTQQSFVDRSSTIQMLLLAQDATDKGIPHLNGETYVIIPRLIIPRVLDPQKPASHEGTYLLNIHYGLQTRDETAMTTIGWGLLNEAYANFGFLGCAGLAVVLGSFYGSMARWSFNTPILSARSLFTMILLNFAMQAEFSASVYVTALFQTAVPLVVVTIFFMKAHPFETPGLAATRPATT